MVRSTFSRLKVLILLGLPVAVFLAHSIWLSWLGAYLVQSGDPSPSEIAVVLAGDLYGNRILKSAQLVQAGFAPKVLVSGPGGLYGHHECDLAIPFAVSKGYPEEWFIAYPHEAHSTLREAYVVLAELRRRKIRKFLLVTSDYHTRRAGRIFHALGRDLDFRVVSAPDEFFRWNSWWHNREAQKTVFLEWSKTIAGIVGL